MGKLRLRQGRPILDPSDPWHLHALHVVYLPILQKSLDKFRWAWNAHTIAGPPIDRGCGGGIPNELFEYPNPDVADAANFEEAGGSLGYALEDQKMKRETRLFNPIDVKVVDPLGGATAHQGVLRGGAAFKSTLQLNV